MTGRVRLDQYGDLIETIQLGNYVLQPDGRMHTVRIGLYSNALGVDGRNMIVEMPNLTWPGNTTAFPAHMLPIESCAAGTFYDEKSAKCLNCTAGFYSKSAGSERCASCEDLENCYQHQDGQTACVQCPDWTRRQQGSFATRSIKGCVCMEGFWAPSAATGHVCTGCPDGGNCSGKLALPFAAQGYWAPQQRRCTDGAPPLVRLENDSCTYSATFIPCSYFNAPACAGGKLDQSSADCSPGYHGRACSRCREGYYKFVGQCVQCGDGFVGYFVNVLLMGTMIGIWFLFNFVLCEYLESVDIFLAFVQMVRALRCVRLITLTGRAIVVRVFR